MEVASGDGVELEPGSLLVVGEDAVEVLLSCCVRPHKLALRAFVGENECAFLGLEYGAEKPRQRNPIGVDRTLGLDLLEGGRAFRCEPLECHGVGHLARDEALWKLSPCAGFSDRVLDLVRLRVAGHPPLDEFVDFIILDLVANEDSHGCHHPAVTPLPCRRALGDS